MAKFSKGDRAIVVATHGRADIVKGDLCTVEEDDSEIPFVRVDRFNDRTIVLDEHMMDPIKAAAAPAVVAVQAPAVLEQAAQHMRDRAATYDAPGGERSEEPGTVDPRGVGMKFDGGKPRVDLILSGFPRALLAVAEVGTFGALKYAEHSWATVPDGEKRYTSAKDRHRLQGAIERDDPETKLRHAAHEAWNALAVLELHLRGDTP